MIIFQRWLRDFHDCGAHGRLSGGGSGESREEAVCNPVPSGGASHPGGNQDAAQFRTRCLWLCRRPGAWIHFVEQLRSRRSARRSATARCFCALSGGVDSSVAAGLLSRAIGKQLTCVFVDHGLLRKNEGDEVESVFGPDGQFDLNFIRVNAQERYYDEAGRRDRAGAEAQDHR